MYALEGIKKETDHLMKFLKRLFLFFAAVLLAGGFCVFYAFKIEPYRLTINEYPLNSRGENSDEIKIVQFSDLHIKEDFTSENLEKAVRLINKQNPDIVIFTGDLYDNYAIYRDDEHITEQLANIQTRYDKIAIWGNRDYGGGAARQYESIMEQAGFTVLKNENRFVTTENGKKILFTGLDDSMLGSPDMPDSSELSNSDYSILLTHEPDTVEYYLGYGYSAVLSGHSHGGQIDIPFLPSINAAALSATSLAEEYSSGIYHLSSDGSSKLYVNTGIGTTHISARFGVVPEVAVFYIYL